MLVVRSGKIRLAREPEQLAFVSAKTTNTTVAPWMKFEASARGSARRGRGTLLRFVMCIGSYRPNGVLSPDRAQEREMPLVTIKGSFHRCGQSPAGNRAGLQPDAD